MKEPNTPSADAKLIAMAILTTAPSLFWKLSMKEPNTPSADAKLIAMAIFTAAQVIQDRIACAQDQERLGMDDEAAVRYAFANLADILASSLFAPQASDKPDEVDNDEADLKHCHGC